jgi:hypothetical protein
MIDYIDKNEVQNSELMKELESINRSINVSYIVGLSVLLSFLFLQSEKTRVTDQLNGIPNAESRPKLNYLPVLSNKLLILTLVIAIKSNIESLNSLLNLEDTEENRSAIKAAINTLLASVLGFIAALIVYDTLSNTPDETIVPVEPVTI